MIGGKSAPGISLSAGISTEVHADGRFFTEGNKGNEVLNLGDSDVVNQTFVDRPLFAPVENLLSVELTQTERLSSVTESGFRR